MQSYRNRCKKNHKYKKDGTSAAGICLLIFKFASKVKKIWI